MTYPVGGYFLTRIAGPAGFLIGLAQALCGEPSRWSHCGIIVSADGAIVEAERGGARLAHISEYAGRPVMVCDGPVWQAMAGLDVVDHRGCGVCEDALRRDIADGALALVHVPYSALDYLALALLHLHLPSAWVRQRVQRSGRAICSQLVDMALRRAGVHLWDDHRLPGDVMPADLAAWAEDWFASQRQRVAP